MAEEHLAHTLPAPSNGHRANIQRHRDAGGGTWIENPGIPIAPEGWLAPLLIMSMLEGNAYGGQIKHRVEELGYGPSRPGTMYRTLRIMEKEGLVVSDQEDDEVLLSRWRFEPTETGEAYLEFWAHSLAQYKEDTEWFLRIHEGIAGSGQPHRAVDALEGGKNGH